MHFFRIPRPGSYVEVMGSISRSQEQRKRFTRVSKYTHARVVRPRLRGNLVHYAKTRSILIAPCNSIGILYFRQNYRWGVYYMLCSSSCSSSASLPSSLSSSANLSGTADQSCTLLHLPVAQKCQLALCFLT